MHYSVRAQEQNIAASVCLMRTDASQAVEESASAVANVKLVRSTAIPNVRRNLVAAPARQASGLHCGIVSEN